MIAESNDAKAFRREESIPSPVARFARIIEMLGTIDLDDQLRGVRYEVDDIGTDRRLPPKARAFKAMCA
jgi:hypothetical protein